ncbi:MULTISPECIES: TfpX/TfpZ family type IV pilin accessory protein [unclassified Acidovorax]|jgi:hypothetical protein|uniref:TfpX/TfpZ family type IV pilin accessory protein n=1 Tax=unclassified Acidovorax TaxID=2684926 RepID=UPI001C48AB17|nr:MULTISPECIES: TfpX/TfpZ family type IV pilin accessory protein [unclassified Acidovorax]MBV7430677.1 hypothetical protein [Acidovorax sp. sif0732]MBV7449101.1 hypothetical protein [Acidovorax sp. sif0715]
MHKQRIVVASKAFGTHLMLSALVALLVAYVVLRVWFPHPFGMLAGGLHLFWILVGVDVVCGPLLTAFLFNPAKSRRELVLDLSLVALIQLAALSYGLYSISQARPVVLAFETDRIVAVSVSQIDPADLPQAPAPFQALSWRGPVLLGTRNAIGGDEKLKSIEMSLQGVEPSARPGWWQPYEDSRVEVQQRMKKLTLIREQQKPSDQASIDAAVQKTGLPIDRIHYLPLTSQKSLDAWIVLLDAEAHIVGYAPVGGFE